MPPLPEHPHRGAHEGIAEILGELEPDHPPETDRHVSITGKIVVQVHQIGKHREPRDRGRKLAGRSGEQALHGPADGVRNNHLFSEADDKPPYPVDEILGSDAALDHIAGDGRVAGDGPLQHLGPEGQEQSERHRALCGGRIAPVHVHDVGNHREGEKRYPDRKMDFRHGERCAAKQLYQLIDVRENKIRVLKNDQRQHVEDNGNGKHRLAPLAGARYPDPEPVVHEKHGQQKQRVSLLPRVVEDKAHDQEKHVSRRRPVPQEKKDQQGDGEKKEQECD